MTKTILPAILMVFSMTACERTLPFCEPGVPLELARHRAANISNAHYDLAFSIPENPKEPVAGRVVIKFELLKARPGVALDFQPGAENIHRVIANGHAPDFICTNRHILISPKHLAPGGNSVEISFTASNQALNRSEEFMYTLFAPDRASTAFPCFDQPDIKATYDLELEIPGTWTALSNGALDGEEMTGGKKIMRFSMGRPISTYLFAFTAGKFKSLFKSDGVRQITMLHRETDQKKVDLNAESIFRHHFESLGWLEKYTLIAYPYGKFDIVLLPGFQYSGMEHPGAIWYRDDCLMLDENAPPTQKLQRAGLIAHETAHMWFGNLVTIKWFNDVWLKEVFAGLMADKMIEPQFPGINHRLQFVLAHYPQAYSVDRGAGTHPIRQELANLNMAGTLYGPVIYSKAPILFRQLERIMRPEKFQEAVREYLNTFSHANAGWDDLVKILDSHSESSISEWSRAWVYGKGMPVIRFDVEVSPRTRGKSLKITQMNNPRMRPFPSQILGVSLVDASGITNMDAWLKAPELMIPIPDDRNFPMLVVLNGGGMGYGYFPPPPGDKPFVPGISTKPDDEVLRAAVFINLFENFLNGGLSRKEYANLLLQAVEQESNAQLMNYLCGNLAVFTRKFLDPEKHAEVIHRAEGVL